MAREKDFFKLQSTILILLLLCSFFWVSETGAGAEDNVFGWAWSSNIGWVSFNCNNLELTPPRCVNDYGVHICADAGDPRCAGVPNADGRLIGYAWSENIGWISFADFNGDGNITIPDQNIAGSPCVPNCEARLNLSTREITGWARALSAVGEPQAGGWDGWIKLRGTAQDGSPYGLSVDSLTKKFYGWAWGGDDSLDTGVIGWLNFNWENPENWGGGPPLPPEYWVETDLNLPPDSPSNLITLEEPCAWGVPANQQAVFSQIDGSPMGYAVIFSWNYFDPENDPQASYEILLSSQLGFPVGQPKFNHIVNSASQSYVLYPPDDDDSDWDSSLSWSDQYYWKVRVKDSGSGRWSEFSDPVSFQPPLHAFPNPDFTWDPPEPNQDEVTQLCSMQEGVCPTDLVACYNPSDSEVDCKAWPNSASFLWTFSPNTVTFTDGTTNASSSPRVKFDNYGLYDTTLRVTDNAGGCSKTRTINVLRPLPGWRER